jgi:[FeFe] hydrogenase H-cluster maturation GTPase HydF
MVGNNTPRALHTVICIIGRRNAGKSSLINAVAGQEVAIVSSHAGTTTDAVGKPYELIPLGPVILYDTAGLDDEGDLGERRMKATRRTLYKSDIAIIVISNEGMQETDKRLIQEVQNLEIPFLVIFNKDDISTPKPSDIKYCNARKIKYISVSASNNHNIDKLKEMIIDIAPEQIKESPQIIGDLIKKDDIVVLVVPIDMSAPKGRLILPQVQILREILDCNAIGITTQETELTSTLSKLKQKPRIVITDSQVVKKVDQALPADIEMTTFSILFARSKSDLQTMVKGADTVNQLKDGDIVLIAEACSHHTQEDDIGKVKIPNWIKKYTGKDIKFEFSAGNDFPEHIEKYSLIVHCGACMINQQEMKRRYRDCINHKIPITNYGVVISKTQGILDRVVKPFK